MSKAPNSTFERQHAAVLAIRLVEPRRSLHVVAGPRQVGKTTLVQQVLAQLDSESGQSAQARDEPGSKRGVRPLYGSNT